MLDELIIGLFSLIISLEITDIKVALYLDPLHKIAELNLGQGTRYSNETAYVLAHTAYWTPKIVKTSHHELAIPLYEDNQLLGVIFLATFSNHQYIEDETLSIIKGALDATS